MCGMHGQKEENAICEDDSNYSEYLKKIIIAANILDEKNLNFYGNLSVEECRMQKYDKMSFREETKRDAEWNIKYITIQLQVIKRKSDAQFHFIIK